LTCHNCTNITSQATLLWRVAIGMLSLQRCFHINLVPSICIDWYQIILMNSIYNASYVKSRGVRLQTVVLRSKNHG